MITPLLLAAAQTMTFTADRIAADNVTKALAATGHIVAAYGPMTVRGESMSRDADGLMLFRDPTCCTTCTNAVGHTHWNVTGEVEYRENESVILRNAWLRFYEVPVLWLPYLNYPLDTDCGFSWMPGYTGRWGAYLLTRYAYHLLGDPEHEETTWWLRAASRLDLRYQQGVAVGEDLDWNLGDFGTGKFNVYYAWDEDAADLNGYTDGWHSYNWGSDIDRDRYQLGLTHRWEVTERDVLRVAGSVYSDSYFRSDFIRTEMFNWKSQFITYPNNGVFWEHLENDFAFGAEVSGRLNKFYSQTGRLPEIYFDVNPQPLFGLPVNYESESRVGYLTRSPAEYGNGERTNPFAFVPGVWADYDAFRFDTYHRLTAPFRTLDDVLAVVPRVGYRGTYWSRSGRAGLTGWEEVEDLDALYRSILEGGVTFAGRGTAWIDERWRHMVEPYFDTLAQKAWLGGGESGSRPYVFDNLDASVMWEDQFAGRARNLPYSYYGVTPGLRNVWEKADDAGRLHPIVDLDVYAAFQFDKTEWLGTSDAHRLAVPGYPNYGKNGCFVMPGARLKWNPASDVSLLARAEYDADDNRVASADFGWRHALSKALSYNLTYGIRDFRVWDFSSSPFSRTSMTSDEFNYTRFQYAMAGFENQPLDWFAWSPYIRWDVRRNELDSVGAWFDYLTDCLGFRFLVEYQNSYTRIDRYEREDNWSFGFFIYLRAFGTGASGLFSND